MSYKKSLSFIIITLVVAALAAVGGYVGGRRHQQPAPPTSGQAADQTAAAEKGENGHEDEHGEEAGPAEHTEQAEAGHTEDDGHGHGSEVSDLDRPVEEMWAARCEHDIPQYECDECRYEIGTVKLDAGLISANDLVRTGLPENRPSHHETRSLPGEVQLDETRTVHVASPLTGLITRGFTTLGAKVQAGSPLFEVDSPEVADAKSAYLKARSTLDFATKGAEREALLFAKKIAAEVEVQEAEAKRIEAETEVAATLGRLTRLGLSKPEIESLSTQKEVSGLHGRVIVRASRAGTVIEGHANPGEHAEMGKDLLTLSDLDRVWILADLKESDLASVSEAAGGKAVVESQGRTFNATLDTIAGRMSEETRTAKARFSVVNTDGLLRPGMFVSVSINLPAAGEVLAVPKSAVLADAGRTFVFVHKEGDYWLRRPVTLGARFDNMVEIVSGLEANQRIITDGSFLLKSDVLRSKMGAGCAD
ncbi:MAG: efflux RND transporter periplasmic adaptor subunit [Deltaproteobacteria bacterium]|nr:efflux RND transporter periplasmic adaptor subunit [Deltaproteobacteria bacterium]